MFEYVLYLLKKERASEVTYLEYLRRNPTAALVEVPVEAVMTKVNEFNLAIEVLEGHGQA